MSRLPTVIIPAAGNSRRFRDAGIDIPKGLIRFKRGDVTGAMLEHILCDYLEQADCEPPLIVVNENTAFPMQNFSFMVEVARVPATLGQAHTVFLGLETLGDAIEGPILVLNSDVGYEYPLEVFCRQAQSFSAAALVFPGEGDTAFSYVDSFPLFTQAREKQVISNWAMAGAYYFSNGFELKCALRSQINSGARHANEFYLSGTFGYLSGEKIAISMQRNQLLQWGTPEDLARDKKVRIEDPAIEAALAPLR